MTQIEKEAILELAGQLLMHRELTAWEAIDLAEEWVRVVKEYLGEEEEEE